MGEGLKHIIGSLSEGGFEGRMSTGSETFPLLICLEANKSVLAIVFSLTVTICQRIWAKPLPKNAKFLSPVDCASCISLMKKYR